MFLGSAWFKLEMGNSRGKSRLAGLSGNCQPGAAVVRLLTRLTDHANGLVSFVVDGDVLLHAYVRMTDMLDGRRCFALDSCG